MKLFFLDVKLAKNPAALLKLIFKSYLRSLIIFCSLFSALAFSLPHKELKTPKVNKSIENFTRDDYSSGKSTAKISNVTLYPNSALIERFAQVKAGDQQLIIKNIPYNFNANNLRVEADKGIEIGETTLKVIERSSPLIAEEQALEDEIRQLSKQLAELEIAEKAAQLELKYLDSLLVPIESTRITPPQNLNNFLSSMHQGSVNAQQKIILAGQNKEKISKILQARRNDLDKIRPAINQLVTITVRLDAKQSGKVTIVYPISNAGWRPAYRAYLQSDTGNIELIRTAQIAQKSGEDWQNVKVKLSTGSPNEKISGPTPYPWELSIRAKLIEHASSDVAVMAAASAPRVSAKRVRALNNEMAAESAPLFEVAVNNGEYLAEYILNQDFDLPADGRKVNVSLNKINLNTNLIAQTSPRLEKSAYLLAQSDIPDGIWPNGELQLYRDSAFVGVTQLDFTNQNKLNLSFGRDELIKVEVKNNENKLGNSGVFVSTNQKLLSDSFIITNLHKKPVKVQILEATPIVQNDKITVESKFTPAISADNWQNRRGVVSWEKTLANKENFTVQMDYLVKWPENSLINGLR